MAETEATLEQIVAQRFATNTGFAKELNLIRAALQMDDNYAWGWHCQIVGAIVDEGVDQIVAQRSSARFMYNAFGVDMTKNADYQSWMERATVMKESQVAGISISAEAVDAMSAIWNQSLTLQFVQSDMSRAMNLLVAGQIAGNKAIFSGLGIKLRKEKNMEEFGATDYNFETTIQWTYDLRYLGENPFNMPGVTALVHARHYLMHEAQVTDPNAPFLKSITFKIDEKLQYLEAIYTYGIQKELEPDAVLDIPYPPDHIVQHGVPVHEPQDDSDLSGAVATEDAAYREHLQDASGNNN
jgi:hypothetical protein